MKVECFCNHFSLAMFRVKSQDTKIRENRQKKQQNNQENQTKICFSVFFSLLFKPFYYSLLFFPASFVNKSTCKFI